MTKQAISWLLIGSFCYGSFITILKYLMNLGYGALELAASIGVILLLIALFYILIKIKEIKNISKINWSKILLLGVLATFAGRMIMFIGQSMTSATNVGFLVKLSALTVIPFAYLLTGEKIEKKHLIPAIVMLFGAFLLSTNGSFTSFNKGDLLIILLAVLLGFTNSLAKQVMKEVSPYLISCIRLVFGNILVISLVWTLFSFNTILPLIKQPFWVIIAGVFGILYLFGLYKGIELIGAAKATIYYLLSAVFTAITAVIFLGEIISLLQAIGGTLILIGAYLLYKKH